MKSVLFEKAGLAGAHLVQLASDVESVERRLSALVVSSVPLVSEVGKLTLEAGGKRLRPAFLILSARATGAKFDIQRAINLGACMELIHMATLIHDDVIDEADQRRGKPTASHQFGNVGSILSGDVMLARAMTLLAEDGDLEMIRAASTMVVTMAEGEAREVSVRGRIDLDEATHLLILREKTAAFVECCCRMGAMMTNAEPDRIAALAKYGHHLGLAFQMVDDLLDYRGQVSRTGKGTGTDFRDGCPTLPLILLYQKANAEQRKFLAQNFGTPASDDVLAEVHSLFEQSGTYAETEARATAEMDLALAALELLPKGSHRDLLAAAGRFVLKRDA